MKNKTQTAAFANLIGAGTVMSREEVNAAYQVHMVQPNEDLPLSPIGAYLIVDRKERK